MVWSKSLIVEAIHDPETRRKAVRRIAIEGPRENSMTTENQNPCLPECERNCWTGQDKHAFGCPNDFRPEAFAAKTPEPVKACEDYCGCEPGTYCFAHKPAPEPQEPITEEGRADKADADAWLALKAENAALKAEVERLKGVHRAWINEDQRSDEMRRIESDRDALADKLAEVEKERDRLEDLVANRARIFENQTPWWDSDSAVIAEGRAILARRKESR
jgi:hypothetical protein